MQPRRDANTDIQEDEEEEDSKPKSKFNKAKIKRIVQISLAVCGVGLILYNTVFSGDSSPPPQIDENGNPIVTDDKPKLPNLTKPVDNSIAQEEIKQQNTKVEFAPRQKVEAFKIQESPSVAPVPALSAPDVPALPDFEFDKPKPKKDPLPPVPIENFDAPKVARKSKKQENFDAGNPAEIKDPDKIVDEKKNINMFAFTDSTASYQSQSKPKTAAKSESDFIVYDKSKLIQATSSDTTLNAQVTQVTNMQNTIVQGKIIPVALETAINSQFPGPIRGVVAKDIFAETGSKILIPSGTRIYGTYSSTVVRGQSRVNITMNRIIRPDGFSIAIAAIAGDQFGRAGIEADVDNRYGEIFTNSILLNFANLGTAVALNKINPNGGQTQVVNSNGSVATTNINPINLAAQSVIQNTSEIVNQLTNGAIALTPIVTLPQGTRLMLIINQDVRLPDYKKATL